MKFLLSIVLFFSVPDSWLTDIESAKKQAHTDHKYILLNFSGSDWCAPCIKLKKDVFESTEFQSFAKEKLVLVRADFPRLKKNRLPEALTKTNEKLAEKYNSKGQFPLTVLLDETGKTIKIYEGYQSSKAAFIQDLNNQTKK